MPLSSEQKGKLKDPTTKVKFEQENPKSPGSKAYQRYDKYKGSTTIQDATQNGANWQDITVDFEKGWLVVEDLADLMVIEEAGGAKRTHPEGRQGDHLYTQKRITCTQGSLVHIEPHLYTYRNKNFRSLVHTQNHNHHTSTTHTNV